MQDSKKNCSFLVLKSITIKQVRSCKLVPLFKKKQKKKTILTPPPSFRGRHILSSTAPTPPVDKLTLGEEVKLSSSAELAKTTQKVSPSGKSKTMPLMNQSGDRDGQNNNCPRQIPC